MINEVAYENPQTVGYQSVIQDDDKAIAFRKLDGSLVYLIGDVTTADIGQAVRDALHHIETIDGLYVHDGKPEERFQLHYETLDVLRRVADQLTVV